MTQVEIVKRVVWKDLTRLTRWECFVEGNVTVPWLGISLMLAYYQYYLLALPFSFFFFLAALRQVHNGFHNALGVGKRVTWFVLFSNSVLMMAATHAVKYNHLRHHKFCLKENDYEGKVACMKWFKALCYGPVHIFQIHVKTLRYANWSYRLNTWIELVAILIFIITAFFFRLDFLIYHILVMVAAEFMTAFFAVWTVHHDTSDDPLLARTQRSLWKNRITMNMFYHMEHHLFPAVPTIKLPALAKRIDQALPGLKKRSTF
ncbi:MAG: fatty acid desaturase [Bacteroidetes bacterium]|nr:fatty acid desaturase [Bacteroidota bacterium]